MRSCRASLSTSPAPAAGPSGRGAVVASAAVADAWQLTGSSRRCRRFRRRHRLPLSASSGVSLGASDLFQAPHEVARHASNAEQPRRRRGIEARARSVDVDDGIDEDDVSFSTSTFRGRQDAPELGGRLVQWYPGHIARAERRLKEALGKVDVVLEVLDARCPSASTHPMLGAWCGGSASGAGLFVGVDGASSASDPASVHSGKPRILVLNRCDQVSQEDRREWDSVLRRHVTGGVAPVWTDGARGTGVATLKKAALAAASRTNAGRARRGLAPRPARAVVVGLPNVGKSAVINRLLGRRVAPSAPRPGVTRDLRWCRLRGGAAVAASSSSSGAPSLDLLDAPGVVPPSLKDQRAAARLAACNDIGQAAYLESAVAAELIDTLLSLPGSRGAGAVEALERRLRVPRDAWETAEDFLSVAAAQLFKGDVEQAGARVLKDYRNGALGAVALEDAGEWAARVGGARGRG